MGDEFNSESDSWNEGELEEWLQEFADARNYTKEELIQQLSSSLWALDELENIVSEAKHHQETTSPTPTPSHGTDDALRSELSKLRDHIKSIQADINTLEDNQETIYTETTDDIETTEEILRYLVNQTDALYERTSRLEDHVESQSSSFEQWRHDQEQLNALLQTALSEGITHGDCERCGTTVNLQLLASPNCPNCNGTFETLEPKSWFFGTTTITVQPERASRTDTRDTARTPPPSRRDDQSTFTPDVSPDSPPSKEMLSEFGFSLDTSHPAETDESSTDDQDDVTFTPSSTEESTADTDEETDGQSFDWRTD